MRKTITTNKQNQQQQQQQHKFHDSIEALKELMKTEFFENYTEQEKKDNIEALIKDLEG